MIGKLALEDGTVFTGRGIGASGTATGEAVFNTGMSGYQEVLTDPSYLGQIVTMTAPMMGNYGVNDLDTESRSLFLSGFVVRELVSRHSNWQAKGGLGRYLADNGVVAIDGVDTRALTRRLRVSGSLKAAISTQITDDRELVALAADAPSMVGRKLADKVSRDEPEQWSQGIPSVEVPKAQLNVVVMDCGAKSNILRCLVSRGCNTTVLPFDTCAKAVLERKPDGVMLCNGPGDPEPVTETIEAIKGLLGKTPIFGICLGHQLLALAMGAKTHKLKFGHHGINHPVRNMATGQVEITSQNHGFAVEESSLDKIGAKLTHRSLNDGSVEGLAHASEAVFAVQYHPESAPGPHDSAYLFDAFVEMMKTKRVPDGIMASG